MALQCGILYSGSKDCSVRSWDLISGRQLSCARDHRDLDLTTDATKVVGSVGQQGPPGEGVGHQDWQSPPQPHPGR